MITEILAIPQSRDWRLIPIRALFPLKMINEELMQYLRCRESVIANHAWRDRDAAGHLEALREVSEQITAWAAEHGGQADARLRHYLANASYAKALAHLEQESDG